MTTINDIADLVRLLQNDPAWADAVRGVLLSQDLRHLPEVVADLAGTVRELAETTNRRLESLENGQAVLTNALRDLAETTNRRLESLENGQAVLTNALRELAETTNRRLERLEQGQAELREGQAQLREGQAELRHTVTGLQTTVDGMQERLGTLELGQSRLQTTVNGLQGDLGNLSGSFFQRRAAAFAERVARREFQLRQPILLHHTDQLGPNPLKQLLRDAADDPARLFTHDAADLVEQADAVIAGDTPDGDTIYLLVEMSVTVVKEDVDRAKDRAVLLQQATGAAAHPLVIGQTITVGAATQARQQEVAFFAFTPRGRPSQDN